MKFCFKMKLYGDFGGKINCGTVSQYLSSLNTLKFVKEFYAKASENEKLSDLVQKFLDYYEPHKSSCNVVHLYHDRSGYKEEVNSKTTLAQDVMNQLRRAGWKVINKTPNKNNPSHILKYRLIENILAEIDWQLPTGEEIQDFFIRCRELLPIQNQQYLMNFALVSIIFEQRNERDEILTTMDIPNLLFVPGRKPKAFPFFTNYPIRRIFEHSEFHLTLDRLIAEREIAYIQPLYQDSLSVATRDYALDRYSFFRKRFKAEWNNKIIEFGGLSFIPFEEKRELILIEWETENLVFDWFSAPLKYQRKEELEVIIGESS